MADDFGAWLAGQTASLGIPRSAPVPKNFLDQVATHPYGYLKTNAGHETSEPTYRMSMADYRDDSAGNYGTWSNPQDQSWPDWLKMKVSDVQEGGRNAELNVLSALSPYGSEGWQVPPAVHEPVNALMRLFGTPSNPGTFTQGPDAPGNADDMRTLLFSMYGGNALNPGRMFEGTAAKAAAAPDAVRALQDAALASKADRQFRKSIDTDWYHAAWPDFQQFNDPTDYLGVHVTRHQPTALDFQAERGGPLLRMDAPFQKPFTMPPADSPAYATALREAQDFLPGFDGTKESLEQNAKAFRDALTSRGYDSIVSQDGRLLDDAYEAIALNPRSLNDAIYSDTGKPTLMGSALAGAEKAKAPDRSLGLSYGSPSKDGALSTEAEATATPLHFSDAASAPRSKVLAENGATEANLDSIRSEALQAFRNDIDRNGSRYFDDFSLAEIPGKFDAWGAPAWGTISPTQQELLTTNFLSNNHPVSALGEALNAAARASGRELDLMPYGSAPLSSNYGTLRTPAGNQYKVRVADHARTSMFHDAPDFNIAPGEMTPDEFINLLPTLYSDTGKPSLMGSALSPQDQDFDQELKGIANKYGIPIQVQSPQPQNYLATH